MEQTHKTNNPKGPLLINYAHIARITISHIEQLLPERHYNSIHARTIYGEDTKCFKILNKFPNYVWVNRILLLQFRYPSSSHY